MTDSGFANIMPNQIKIFVFMNAGDIESVDRNVKLLRQTTFYSNFVLLWILEAVPKFLSDNYVSMI